MATLSYSKALVAGTPENVNDVQTMFDEAKASINSVTNAQVASSAGIVDSKLASPNNSAYKTILGVSGSLVSATAQAYLPLGSGGAVANGANTQSPLPVVHFVAADYTVGGLTQKLRVRGQVGCNATAPAVNVTIGMAPIVVAGAANQLAFTLGAAVTGSSFTLTTPSASTFTTGASAADFTIPSDGVYCLFFQPSGSQAANSIISVTIQLQTRNV